MDPQVCQELIAGLRQIVDEYRAECLRERNWRIASFAKRQSVELPNRGNGNLNLEKEESSSVETNCCAKPKKCNPQIWSKDNIKRSLKMRGITTIEKRRAKKRRRVANKVQFQREINFDLKVQEKIQETVIVARINRGRTFFDHHRNNGGKRFVTHFAKPSRFSFVTFDPGGESKHTVYAVKEYITFFSNFTAALSRSEINILVSFPSCIHAFIFNFRDPPPLVSDLDLIFVFDPGGNFIITFDRVVSVPLASSFPDDFLRVNCNWEFTTRTWCKPDPSAQGRNAPLPSSWLCSAAPLLPSLRRTSPSSRAWPFACSTAMRKQFGDCPQHNVILSKCKGNSAILSKDRAQNDTITSSSIAASRHQFQMHLVGRSCTVRFVFVFVSVFMRMFAVFSMACLRNFTERERGRRKRGSERLQAYAWDPEASKFLLVTLATGFLLVQIGNGISTEVRIKKLQSTYPVFFLTNGGSEVFEDVRRNTLEEALKLCLDNGLEGYAKSRSEGTMDREKQKKKMAQVHREEKIHGKTEKNVQETIHSSCKFNVQAPEFVPRSHTPQPQVPNSSYFYPCFQILNGFVCDVFNSAVGHSGFMESACQVFDKSSLKDIVAGTALSNGYVRNDHPREALKCFVRYAKNNSIEINQSSRYDLIDNGTFQIGRGDKVKFWTSRWCGPTAFSMLFPALFQLVEQKHIIVAELGCWNEGRWNGRWEFFDACFGSEVEQGADLKILLQDNVLVSKNDDKWLWNIENNKIFSVKSCYSWLVDISVGTISRWKLGDDMYLVARCEVHSVVDLINQRSFPTLNALNEFGPKYAGVDWRQKLENQRGVVLATELKNNANKLAKWTAQALLESADMMKLGYVSRIHPRDHFNHVISVVIAMYMSKVLWLNPMQVCNLEMLAAN